MKEKPLVSVCCITYNHELYIRQAINGFLMQKTSFPIEIIIHDDASTDNTARIIKEFEDKYPDIIVPIYQKINQYSLGIKPLQNIVWPIVRGKYIALCEGDDYWIDPLKLQKQVEFLENKKNISIVIHPVKLEKDGKIINERKFDLGKENRFFYSTDIIKERGQFAATCSYVLREEVVKQLPSWSDRYPVGDFLLEMYSQKVGKGLYLPDVMGVYRISTHNSWTNRVLAIPTQRKIFSINMMKYYTKLKEDFPKLTEADFSTREIATILSICKSSLIIGDFNCFNQWVSILEKKYSKYLQKKSSIIVFKNYPQILHLYLKLKNKIVFILKKYNIK